MDNPEVKKLAQSVTDRTLYTLKDKLRDEHFATYEKWGWQHEEKCICKVKGWKQPEKLISIDEL